MTQQSPLTTVAIEELMQRLREMIERVAPLLTPARAADLQERVWEHRVRLEEFARTQHIPTAPLVMQPRRLPRALNPLYFNRTKP